MLKSGNARPERCAENLMSIVRGEIPFDRVRGLSARVVDGPADVSAAEIEQDALWNIETYEPRIDAESVEVRAEETGGGDFRIGLLISDASE